MEIEESKHQEFIQILQDTGASWKKHMEVVNKLLEGIQSGDQDSLDFVVNHPKLFGDLLYNLRSNFVNQLCNLLIVTAKQQHSELQHFAESILFNPSMNRCLQSGNKVILQFSQLCFQTFFQQNLVDFKHLVQLIENNKQQKSYQIRAEIAKGVSIYINNKLQNGEEVSKDEKNFLDETLKMFLKDKAPQVRKAIKKGEQFFEQLSEGKRQSLTNVNHVQQSNDQQDNQLSSESQTNTSQDPGVDMLEKLSQFQTNSLEKKRLLAKFQKSNFHAQPNLELMKKALEINQSNKKMDIQKLIESILFLMNINSFSKELLVYLSEKNLNENLVYKKFLKRVTKIDLEQFVQVFNEQVSYSAFSLLNKKATSQTMKNLKSENKNLFNMLVENLTRLKDDSSLNEKEQQKATKFLSIITKDSSQQADKIPEVKKTEKIQTQNFMEKQPTQNFTDKKQKKKGKENNNENKGTKIIDSIFNNSDQNLKISYLMDLKHKTIQVNEQNYLMVMDELAQQSQEVENSFQHDIKILEQILSDILQFSNELTQIFIPYFSLLNNEEKFNFNIISQFFQKVQSQRDFVHLLSQQRNLTEKIFAEIFPQIQNNPKDQNLVLILSLLLQQQVNQNEKSNQIVQNKIESIFQQLQENLTDQNILLRKETVLIFANLDKFLQEDQYNNTIRKIKPEYQELIQHYQKKTQQ